MDKQANRKVTLHWVHTSDLHGHLFMHDDLKDSPTKGGVSAVYGFVESFRRKCPGQIICTDGGDCLQGQPLSYYYNYVRPEYPNIVTAMMNEINYDAAVIGNHDIETGHEVYDRWIRETKHTILGANMLDNRTGKPYLKPYKVIERQGIRIAILGLITPTIDHWLPESLWSGTHFQDMVSCAQEWIPRIQAEAHPHLIVGLFHSGWEGGIESVHGLENSTRLVAEQVPGFDLILYGHDHKHAIHTVTCADGSEVLCVAPSSFGSRIVQVNLKLTLQDNQVVKKHMHASVPFLTGQVHPDTILLETEYAPMRRETLDWLEHELAEVDEELSEKEAYFGPCPFINLVHQLQLLYSGADVSLAAPLSFDAVIHSGALTIRDMFNLYRYENFLYVLSLSGQELQDLLEFSYSRWVSTMKGPDDHIMCLAPVLDNGNRLGFEHLAFNFVSAAGVVYTVDVSKPEGHRVHIMALANGEAFALDAQYRVAVNSYHGSGGGELLTLGAGIPKKKLAERIVESTTKDIRKIFIEYLEKVHHVDILSCANWAFIPQEWAENAIKRDKEILFGR